MNKQEVKQAILEIINHTNGYFIADDIYQRLSDNIDQEEHRKLLEST